MTDLPTVYECPVCRAYLYEGDSHDGGNDSQGRPIHEDGTHCMPGRGVLHVEVDSESGEVREWFEDDA